MPFIARPTLFAAASLACALLASASCAQTPPNPNPTPPPLPASVPLWTDKERAAITAYWAAPGRYLIASPPDVLNKGVWQVHLTPEGSTWLLAYQRAIGGSAKTPPTADAKPSGGGAFGDWEKWVAARLAADRFLAQQNADAANRPFLLQNAPVNPVPSLLPPLVPAGPGPAPASLVAACGNPPPLAGIYAPLSYTVTIGDIPSDETFTYTDNVPMRPRFAYYRFARGVNSDGQSVAKMPQSERDVLFQSANFTASDQRIFEAVSKLEGGFDSVQTYDTGFLSVGFIQFVTLAEGKHDLSNVLLSEKINRPADFAADFHNFGIDVQPDLTLTVVDPQTGVELSGSEAVLKIIDDKRLVAVFQRAGRRVPFRVAQIKVAKSYYWPASDPVNVNLGDGSQLAGTVGDIIHSEAGMATLLDRKINTGNIRLLSDVTASVLARHKGKTLQEAAQHEREIVSGMKYRTDFLEDVTLTQPLDGRPAPPKPEKRRP